MDLSAAMTAIVNPAEQTPITVYSLSADQITGFISTWAGGNGYTKRMVLVSMADVTEAYLEALSKELAFRFDRYARTSLSASAVKRLPSAAQSANKAATANPLQGKVLSMVRPYFLAAGVPPWEDGSYVGIAHALAAFDMFNDLSASGYVSIARYSPQRINDLFKGEIGELYGVRWLLSNASVLRLYGTAATSATVGLSGSATGSNAYVFGPDPFWNLELESGGVEVIHQPLGSAGTADPAAQLGTLAVHCHYGVLSWNPAAAGNARIMRIPHGLTLKG